MSDSAAVDAEKVLRHVVLLSFTPESTRAQVQAIEEAFTALPAQIDAIHALEWGTDVSVENIAQGYSHCFLVTFRSAADRDAYLPHPAHQAFVEKLRPHLAQVLVVDYWIR